MSTVFFLGLCFMHLFESKKTNFSHKNNKYLFSKKKRQNAYWQNSGGPACWLLGPGRGDPGVSRKQRWYSRASLRRQHHRNRFLGTNVSRYRGATCDSHREILVSGLEQGLATFFYQESDEKYFRLRWLYNLMLQLFVSAIVAQKHPETILKQVSMTVFQ